MALTSAELAKIREGTFDGLVRSRISENVSPFMQMLKYNEAPGLSYKYTQESTLPTSQYRAENADVTASNGENANITVSLTSAAQKFTIDSRLYAGGQNDMVDDQTRKQVDAMLAGVNYSFFKGDNSANNEFDGLEQFNVNGYTKSVPIATNGNPLSLAALDEAKVECKGTNKALFVNQNLFLRLQTASRSSSISGQLMYAPDQFGKYVPMYDGLPIYMAGETTAGAQVLTFDETQGTSDVCTSAYIVDFEEGVRGLQLGEITPKTVEASFGKTISFEWLVAFIVQNKNGVVRIKGITDAAITA